MNSKPFSVEIVSAAAHRTNAARFDTHLIRRLSDLGGYFTDEQAYQEKLAAEDTILYEVFEIRRPEEPGELLSGLSVVHPGVIGDEFFLTKGHYHSVRETAEIYYGIGGRGLLLMETEEGEWSAEEVTPGRVVYVPPRWAHRSVNLSLEEDFVTFFVYPGNAGHDYGSIAGRGFRKLVLRDGNGFRLADNPARLAAAD